MSATTQHSLVVVVKNAQGLHMRPASKLVQTASSFQSQIELERSGQVADCRSILSLLTLAAPQGCELTLRVQGTDADDAFQSICDLFDRQFDEPLEED